MGRHAGKIGAIVIALAFRTKSERREVLAGNVRARCNSYVQCKTETVISAGRPIPVRIAVWWLGNGDMVCDRVRS